MRLLWTHWTQGETDDVKMTQVDDNQLCYLMLHLITCLCFVHFKIRHEFEEGKTLAMLKLFQFSYSPELLEQQGQFLYFVSTLKTFVFDIKR